MRRRADRGRRTRVAVTKLVPRGAPRTLLPRDQPVAALDRLVEAHPVTLVTAPAGKSHFRSIYRKLGIESRAAAIEQATHLGLL